MLLKCTPPGVWSLRMLKKSPPCMYIILIWEQPTNRHEQDSAHRTNKVLIKWKQAPDSARQLLRQFTRWRVGGKRCDQNLWGIIVCNFQLSVIFRCWLLATFMYECISNKQVWTKHVVVVVIGVGIWDLSLILWQKIVSKFMLLQFSPHSLASVSTCTKDWLTVSLSTSDTSSQMTVSYSSSSW